MEPIILPAFAVVFLFGGQPSVPIETMELCKTALVDINAEQIRAKCVKVRPTDAEAADAKTALLLEEIAAMEIERVRLKKLWERTDRSWCYGIKYLGTDPDDKLYWPDLRACRGDSPPCEWTPSKPGPCPTKAELAGEE
jgi:hypothetical protein